MTLLAGVALVLGLSAYRDARERGELSRATSDVAVRLARAREVAIASGQTQTLVFSRDPATGSDYRVAEARAGGGAWRLPAGVTYLWAPGTRNQFRMTSDGRCSSTGLVILRDRRGLRDTVSVSLSGEVRIHGSLARP